MSSGPLFVKKHQRWLWYAIDHDSSAVLAFTLGGRKDKVLRKLKKLLASVDIKRYFTDDWGAYRRELDPGKHVISKLFTQKIERKNLSFRTWIKRLSRQTICFSKSVVMHDTVIALLINHSEFSVTPYARTLLRHYPVSY